MAPCQLGFGTSAGQGAMRLSVDVREYVDQLNSQLSGAEQQRHELLRAVPRQTMTVALGHRILLSLAFPGLGPGCQVA
jgi:hypothetical protein